MSLFRVLPALLVLLAAVLPAAAQSGPLEGRWTVTSLAGAALDTPGGDITFDPAEGSISGATACNFFRGGYEQSGEKLTIKVGMMTRRACPGPAEGHERGFLDAMAQTAAFRIDGDTLTLTGTGGTELASFTRTPDAALEGQPHKIVSYFKDGGLYSAKPDPQPVIAFKDGKIDGETGCRPFTARYTRDGQQLTITNVEPAQTSAPCAGDVRDQDAAILAALPRVTTFDTSRNLIRLLDQPDGAAMLWITPVTP